MRSNVIFLPLPLKPHHFENDLQVYDPAELDSHYSADFLERMAEFEQEIAAIVARTKQERIIKIVAKSKGRELTEQEINLVLDQARALGELD